MEQNIIILMTIEDIINIIIYFHVPKINLIVDRGSLLTRHM